MKFPGMLPLFIWRVQNGFRGTGAGIIDQDIHTAELPLHIRHHSIYVRRIRDIASHAETTNAPPFNDCIRLPFHALVTSCTDCNIDALSSKRLRNRKPDTEAPPRDKGLLSFQF
jgi:hypothetical protein